MTGFIHIVDWHDLLAGINSLRRRVGLESRFSEQQLAFILRQSEEGTSVEEVCRKAGGAARYNWRKAEAF
jgi:hypothetical protein